MPIPVRPVRPVRTAAAVLLATLAVAACAGGGNDLAVDTPPPAPDPQVTTPVAPVTTSTTEVQGPAAAPLTGELVDDADLLERPALFLKIDNHPAALPQQGLDEADLVIEMLAEFQLSRFAAVFHSTAPEHVGPVRSSRTSDFDLLRAFDSPLYGSSGGNDNVLAGMASLPVHAVTAHSHTEEYYRDPSRSVPHNLYVDTEDLFALAPDDADAPSPWFSYRAEGDALPAPARPAEGRVTVRWGFPVTFEWDEERQGWRREQDGDPHELANGSVVAPPNVVILTAAYGTSSADPNSPELQSVGEGEALVLTAGHLIPGRWVRSSPQDPPSLFAEDGTPIALTPGQTWVLWPRDGKVTY